MKNKVFYIIIFLLFCYPLLGDIAWNPLEDAFLNFWKSEGKFYDIIALFSGSVSVSIFFSRICISLLELFKKTKYIKIKYYLNCILLVFILIFILTNVIFYCQFGRHREKYTPVYQRPIPSEEDLNFD